MSVLGRARRRGAGPLAQILGGGATGPFDHDGLATRALPFAAVAVLAAASIVLPPGPTSAPEALGSIGLLVLVAAAFLLPWETIPSAAAVLVPVAYSGSILLLVLSTGTVVNGISIVLLVPLVWTALYHRPWESAVIVVTTAAVQLVTALVPVALPPSVVTRRVTLWVLVAGLVTLATHLLRARLRRISDAREAMLRQTAALVTASAELTAIMEVGEVLSAAVRLAAELVSSPGGPALRAQYVRVAGDLAQVVAEHDDTGRRAVGVSFAVSEHPNLPRVLRDRRAFWAPLAPAEAGATVQAVIEHLGVTHSIYVPIQLEGELDGVLSLSVRSAHVPEDLVGQCEALGHVLELALSNARANQALHAQAMTDALTGLPNRRGFEEFLENRPGRSPFVILALDVDGLKKVNDTQGHAAGDQLLVRFASAVKGVMRRGDVLGRLGGDEFAAYLFDASEDDGKACAERILDAVSESGDGSSVSVGLAVGSAKSDAAPLLRAADTAMYAAKRAGGRRYEVATPLPGEAAGPRINASGPG